MGKYSIKTCTKSLDVAEKYDIWSMQLLLERAIAFFIFETQISELETSVSHSETPCHIRIAYLQDISLL